MSNNSVNPSDGDHEQAGPLTRMKPLARIAFAIILISPILAGLIFAAINIWRDGSRSIARTDWSFWTWPRVLVALYAVTVAAMVVVGRIRIARRRSGK
jgi:hypothetical protein